MPYVSTSLTSDLELSKPSLSGTSKSDSSTGENDSCHDRRDVDDLDECEQGVVSKDAVTEKQCPGKQPDYPC